MAKVTCEQYTTTTCGVCKMTKPIIDKAVSLFNEEQLEFKRLVCDTPDEEMAKAQALNINNMPTFVFYVNGEEKFRHVGPMNLVQFKGKVTELLD